MMLDQENFRCFFNVFAQYSNELRTMPQRDYYAPLFEKCL